MFERPLNGVPTEECVQDRLFHPGKQCIEGIRRELRKDNHEFTEIAREALGKRSISNPNQGHLFDLAIVVAE